MRHKAQTPTGEAHWPALDMAMKKWFEAITCIKLKKGSQAERSIVYEKACDIEGMISTMQADVHPVAQQTAERKSYHCLS